MAASVASTCGPTRVSCIFVVCFPIEMDYEGVGYAGLMILSWFN